MSKIYDISWELSPDLEVWPGDQSVEQEINAKIGDGDSVNLSQMKLSLHAGTHADAPYHYTDEGKTIELVELEIFKGDAYLIYFEPGDSASGGISQQFLEEKLADLDPFPERVLIYLNAWRGESVFPEGYPVLEPEAIRWLASRGVRLIGLDSPSVDEVTSKDLPNHQSCFKHGIYILENLLLGGVPEGSYELIALPLKIKNGDGSPVRAILIDK